MWAEIVFKSSISVDLQTRRHFHLRGSRDHRQGAADSLTDTEEVRWLLVVSQMPLDQRAVGGVDGLRRGVPALVPAGTELQGPVAESRWMSEGGNRVVRKKSLTALRDKIR